MVIIIWCNNITFPHPAISKSVAWFWVLDNKQPAFKQPTGIISIIASIFFTIIIIFISGLIISTVITLQDDWAGLNANLLNYYPGSLLGSINGLCNFRSNCVWSHSQTLEESQYTKNVNNYSNVNWFVNLLPELN